MLNAELQDRDASVDPAARYATDTEIEIAYRLRHQLEERYLAPYAPPAPWRTEAKDTH